MSDQDGVFYLETNVGAGVMPEVADLASYMEVNVGVELAPFLDIRHLSKGWGATVTPAYTTTLIVPDSVGSTQMETNVGVPDEESPEGVFYMEVEVTEAV